MNGSDLRTWRKERGLSQGQLADLLDMTQPMISQMESGQRPVPDGRRELYPGQAQQESEDKFEPSVEEEIRELLSLSDPELERALATAGRPKEPELSGEARRRGFERYTGKIADGRPRVPIGSSLSNADRARAQRLAKEEEERKNKPAPVKTSWMPGKGPPDES